VKCLEIGAGDTPRPDYWIMTDLEPRNARMTKMDATTVFPFEPETFDYVYSEHMIEHVPINGGRNMMHECYRVLKPGGVVRIVTPGMDFLIRMVLGDPAMMDYAAWSHGTFCRDQPHRTSVVFNNFVRAWGHQFIYDRTTLEFVLTEAGFRDIVFPKISESVHTELCDLESVRRLPPGFLEIESMIIEGIK
jgi:predicted SAM-dependent methyltransferase